MNQNVEKAFMFELATRVRAQRHRLEPWEEFSFLLTDQHHGIRLAERDQHSYQDRWSMDFKLLFDHTSVTQSKCTHSSRAIYTFLFLTNLVITAYPFSI